MAKRLALVGKIGPAFTPEPNVSLMEIRAHGSVTQKFHTRLYWAGINSLDLGFSVIADNMDGYWDGLADPALAPILRNDR